MLPSRIKQVAYRKRQESSDDAGLPLLVVDKNSATLDTTTIQRIQRVNSLGGKRRLDAASSRQKLPKAPASGSMLPLITIAHSSSVGGSMPILTKKPSVSDGVSVPSQCFNLMKNIVGAGVLGLPAGIATFGDYSLGSISNSHDDTDSI